MTEPTDIQYDIKLPEGSGIEVSSIIDAAKVLGLTNEQAQKMADVKVNESVEHKKNIEKQFETWKSELMADKEIGGENFAKTIETRDRGINDIAKKIPAIKDFLNQNKLADNPVMVRLFNEIGKMSEDDTRVSSKSKEIVKPVSMADRLINNYNIQKG